MSLSLPSNNLALTAMTATVLKLLFGLARPGTIVNSLVSVLLPAPVLPLINLLAHSWHNPNDASTLDHPNNEDHYVEWFRTRATSIPLEAIRDFMDLLDHRRDAVALQHFRSALAGGATTGPVAAANVRQQQFPPAAAAPAAAAAPVPDTDSLTTATDGRRFTARQSPPAFAKKSNPNDADASDAGASDSISSGYASADVPLVVEHPTRNRDGQSSQHVSTPVSSVTMDSGDVGRGAVDDPGHGHVGGQSENPNDDDYDISGMRSYMNDKRIPPPDASFHISGSFGHDSVGGGDAGERGAEQPRSGNQPPPAIPLLHEVPSTRPSPQQPRASGLQQPNVPLEGQVQLQREPNDEGMQPPSAIPLAPQVPPQQPRDSGLQQLNTPMEGQVQLQQENDDGRALPMQPENDPAVNVAAAAAARLPLPPVAASQQPNAVPMEGQVQLQQESNDEGMQPPSAISLAHQVPLQQPRDSGLQQLNGQEQQQENDDGRALPMQPENDPAVNVAAAAAAAARLPLPPVAASQQQNDAPSSCGSCCTIS